MSEEGYMMAWAVYLGAAVVTLAVLWWLSGRWSLAARVAVRAVAIAVLFTPWPVAMETDTLGPAWVVALFDTLVQSEGTPLRAGAPLITAVALALVISAGLYVWRRAR